MPLLHPGATFPEQSLTVPGRATVKVPEMFGCQFGVMLFYPGSWCPHCNALTGQTRRPLHTPTGPPGTGPLVTFARRGISAPFAASRRSVLDLADARNVPSRWACRTDVCHTCATPLLSGDVTYSPDSLEPPADGEVLICCAQPGTDVLLEM